MTLETRRVFKQKSEYFNIFEITLHDIGFSCVLYTKRGVKNTWGAWIIAPHKSILKIHVVDDAGEW